MFSLAEMLLVFVHGKLVSEDVHDPRNLGLRIELLVILAWIWHIYIYIEMERCLWVSTSTFASGPNTCETTEGANKFVAEWCNLSNTASAPVGCPTGNRSPNVTGAPHGYKKVGRIWMDLAWGWKSCVSGKTDFVYIWHIYLEQTCF